MIEPFLKSQLEPIARRQRRLQLWRSLAFCWLISAFIAIVLIALHRLIGWGSFPTEKFVVGIGAAVAAFVLCKRAAAWQPDYRQIARKIEEHHPELHALLLTAIEQEPDPDTGRLSYLQDCVIREALAESQKHNWIQTVSDGQRFWTQTAHLATLSLFVIALLNLQLAGSASAKRSLIATKGVTVTPGDTSLEKGSALVVLARFSEPLPAEATLVLIGTPDGSRRVPLIKNLEDPVFGGSIPEVSESLLYSIEYGGRRTRDFKVTVFEYPNLQRADAQLTFPEYTSLPEKKIDDTRRISAVEGSLLDLDLQLNKPVVSAKLISKDQTVVSLSVATNRASASLLKFHLQASKTYDLQLVDFDGRTNKIPAEFVLNVLKNRAPELKLASPRGDQRVSPLEEIAFQAEAWDDFGLKGYGLTYTLGGEESKTIVVGEPATNAVALSGRQSFKYLLSLEELAVQPDQLISYFVWADDIGPDGKLRRTSSDMFFAEVRPFEEIFREEQSSPSESEQQQQSQNESTKLAELQKQIINATWKLQRQENSSPGAELSAPYKKDLPVVTQSQEHALDQAGAMKEHANDARSKLMVEKVEEHMEKAVTRLKEAAKSTAALPLALASEQAAYQALLKLAAHEYRVSQGGRGAGSGSGQRNQQQLDQLELKQSENRYETQRQAASPQNPEQREQLQVLNRLKELAQRQEDLNSKLKELQTALQEAKTEQEREDLRRQLKRLRDEEREMLADIDELRQRMEQPQNQSRMAEARQQLEQSRSEVQRAAEALENGSVPQALTSGTRAQRELQELRDDFRKKNSSQFAEDMRQMRSDARDLAQNEEELGPKLDALADTKRKTLSDTPERKEVAQQLDQQKSKMENLANEMRRVTEQAEVAEPLLSKQLYDTLRKATQEDARHLKETRTEMVQRGLLTKDLYDLLESAGKDGSLKSLEVTSELLRSGNTAQANQLEQRARKNIGELKQGVERAAQSVLGDDTEALRMAKRELDDLTQQVEKEMAQAGNQPGQGATDPQSREGRQPSEQTSGQRGQPSAGPGEKNQGEQQGQAGAGPAEEQTERADNSQNRKNQQSASASGESTQAGQDSQQQGNNPQSQANSRASNANRGAQGQQGQGQGQRGQQGQQGEQGQQGQGGQQGSGSASGDSPRNGLAQGQNSSSRNELTSRDARNRNGSRQEGGRNFFDQGDNRGGPEDGGAEPRGPLTGSDYAEWSDRLRDVEEMIDPSDLRNEIARIRDRARAMRVDFKRHSKNPQWDLVKSQIATPLAEVRSRIAEELAHRESNDALVPIDRDPVPAKFSDLVRRYYEKLGSSE